MSIKEFLGLLDNGTSSKILTIHIISYLSEIEKSIHNYIKR